MQLSLNCPGQVRTCTGLALWGRDASSLLIYPWGPGPWEEGRYEVSLESAQLGVTEGDW